MVHRETNEEMGIPAQYVGNAKNELGSDDSLQWEDFFGGSVDIASVLLDMYDTLVAKNKSAVGAVTMRDSRCYPGIYHDKKRPLSTSSVSSSSSSSSSSLPRNDVKKSYLASIESLEDDEFGEDGRPQACNTLASNQQTIRPRWCDPNLSHIDRVLLEIVETERTYVRDLKQIIEGYLKHISSLKDTKISQQNLIDLFSNIEDICQFNSLFLEELEQCGLDPVAVARCFVENSNGFVIYTQYCTNYPKTVSVLTETMRNPETAEVLKERQTALHHSLPLGSFLLKPVQRILKYHLLLQNIVKNSEKESVGYADVKNALSVMTGIAYHINDMKRKHEHAVRVQEIQSLLYGWEGQDLTTYGELVAEGMFRMFRAKAIRHLFLFDKMLLIAKKREESILCYKTHIMCSNLMLIESIQGEPLCFHVIPFDNPRYQYTLQARNLDQKREWCLQLKRVILENYNAVIPSHARQLVMELGQSRRDDGSVEKSTSKRQLSAPEYLERRKQERRKSEISLNRAFRLKKGVRKGILLTPKASPSIDRRGRQDYATESCVKNTEENYSVNNSCKSVEDQENSFQSMSSADATSELDIDKNEIHLERSVSCVDTEQQRRHTWKTWNSYPGETTDTEAEECSERYDTNNQSLQNSSFLREKRNTDYDDENGDYVTFFFANSRAQRVAESSHDLTDDSCISAESIGNETDGKFSRSSISNLTVSKSVDAISTCAVSSEKGISLKKNKKWENCKSTENVQDRVIGLHRKRNSAESNSSGKLWKHNAAVRRVQSFTGMAKAKVVASLHQSFSFRQSASVGSTPKKQSHSHSDSTFPLKRPCDLNIISPQRISSLEDLSPITPAAWLKLQHEHLSKNCAKCGSLPRSFQLNQEHSNRQTKAKTSVSLPVSPGYGPKPKMRMGTKSQFGEQRPFTIAADKPNSIDLDEDFEHYVQYSPCAKHYSLSQDEEQETTGCTNTPSVSMENVHSIHPEHKIYRHSASKYSALKNVFSNMGSKLAGLKATITPHLATDHSDSCSNMSADSDYIPRQENPLDRSSSRSSIRSERDISPKVLTAKLVHSVAKAYSSVIKHHLKRNDSSRNLTSLINKPVNAPVPFYKQGSSAIGARMAKPFESEYSVPKNCTPLLQTKCANQDDLRPGSVFSECSHITSSTDSNDKTLTRENVALITSSFKNHEDEHDDTPSETSDTSADSYYERTFEAIESVLTEEIFRDSAIYSDPEDGEFGNSESPFNDGVLTKEERHHNATNKDKEKKSDDLQLELSCKRPVNRAIVERLRILEANAKFRKTDSFSTSDDTKQEKSKHCEIVNGGQDCESETSSEHSCSTVSTVLETNSQQFNSLSSVKTQTRTKGWVKHVVDKFQGENCSG